MGWVALFVRELLATSGGSRSFCKQDGDAWGTWGWSRGAGSWKGVEWGDSSGSSSSGSRLLLEVLARGFVLLPQHLGL